MVDLKKFSIEDLKKSYNEIGEYLKKAKENDYVPDASVEHGEHEKDDLDGAAKKVPVEDKSEGKDKSVSTDGKGTVKKDFPTTGGEPEGNGNGSEGMTEPSEADVLQQILAILQEIRGQMKAPVAPTATPPTDQIQMSAEAPTPTPTPSTSVPDKKGDININVTKSQVEEILKGMGFAPSATAPKPKVANAGHPIEKTGEDLTLAKIGKMSWSDVHNMNDELLTNRDHF